MTLVESRVGWWRHLPLLFCAPGLLSCSGSDTLDARSEPPSDPKEPSEIAGGQSGNEGGDTSTPCLSEETPLVSGVVTALDAGCATVGDVEVLNDAEVLGTLDETASLRGAYRPYFAGESIEVGQTVYALYLPGPNGAADGSLQLAVVEEGVVLLRWRGISYESSLEELTSEECTELFLGRPFAEEGTSTEEEIPTPLSCGEDQ